MSKCNPPYNNANYKAPRMQFAIDSQLDKAQKKPYLDVELQEMLKDLPFNLREQLKEIASDDGINYTDYSTKEIIDEAKEFKLRYDGNIGFMEQDMLNGDFGASDKKEAQKGYRDIKRFLSKYQ